jgi:multiple sugar transport system substrate-binding protein
MAAWRSTRVQASGQWRAIPILLSAVLIALLAPGVSPSSLAQPPRRDPPKRITVWFHGGLGQALDAMRLTFRDFEAEQDHRYIVDLTLVPEGSYADVVRVAGRSGDLPCLLALDAPLVPHFAWLGYLQPIDRFLTPALRKDLLPSILAESTYQHRLYALGIYDSGLAIFGNRRHLRAAGVRQATVDRPWTAAEFETAMEKLTALRDVDYALDLKMNYGRGEFFTYAFSPILQSSGGDLIDRRSYQSARRVLDGPESVMAMKRLQRWFRKGWATLHPTDDTDFVHGKASLSWAGHWTYHAYEQALGDDLLLLPMPDFGHGPKTGIGTWVFTIARTCQDPDAAWALLRYSLRRDQMLRWADLNPGIPSRKSVLAASPLHKPGGRLYLYVEQLQRGWPVPRPNTPAYPAISGAFSRALDDIVHGADVQATLTRAADQIDRDIAAHKGYQ